jgi:transglutaminase-like putative cysteine protease
LGALFISAGLFVPVRPCLAQQGEKVVSDEWQALYVGDGKAGYVHEQVKEKTSGAVTYETQRHEEFTLRRVGQQMRLIVDATVLEDAEGKLIRFTSRSVQGPLERLAEGQVEGGQLVVQTTMAGATTTDHLPVPQGLCARAQTKLMEAKGYEAGTVYELKAFVPEFPGRDVILKVTVGPKEAVRVFEVTKRLHRRDVEMNILPGVPTSDWVDDGGTVWLTRATLGPGLVIETRKVTKELALAPDEPADILLASFVKPDKPIARPREVRRLEIVVSAAQPLTQPLTLPSDPCQHVEAAAGGALKVTLQAAAGDPQGSYALPYAGSEYAALLQPNKWLETKDPLVVSMAAEALKGEKDALKAARNIERYVHEAITEKGLGLGMATAAETAAQKAGDCTEHAVLAAALARAAGMPSRVVGGLVYVQPLPGAEEGAFGYHMWTEVYVGEWLPLDSALGGHDATHLALVRDDLNGFSDLLDLVAAISQFLGKVRIEVIKTEW